MDSKFRESTVDSSGLSVIMRVFFIALYVTVFVIFSRKRRL